MPPRRPRHVRTRRTQVWLSEEAHAQIKGWAARQGLSVSAGIEALVRVSTGGGADLAPVAPVAPGGALDVVAMHTNEGFGDAPASTTRFALVREPAPRPPAGAPRAGAGGLSAALGEVTVPALAAGRADFPFLEGGSWRFTVPAGVRGGTYRVRACADAPGTVREGREDNNCRLSATRLQIGG
jgi:hypothetical protein